MSARAGVLASRASQQNIQRSAITDRQGDMLQDRVDGFSKVLQIRLEEFRGVQTEIASLKGQIRMSMQQLAKKNNELRLRAMDMQKLRAQIAQVSRAAQMLERREQGFAVRGSLRRKLSSNARENFNIARRQGVYFPPAKR